jgi:uncharacterized protein
MGRKWSPVQIRPSRPHGMKMERKLIDVLACPICKGKLEYHRHRKLLVCKRDKLGYPIRGDVIIMVKDKAYEVEI